MGKSLIVYYSRSGHTRKVAEDLAARLGCDVEEIREARNRRGVFGYFRSGREAFREQMAEIEQCSRDPAAYDLVILGTPVWAGNLSSPLRSYVSRFRGQFRDVAFFCTQGGRGSAKVFSRLQALTGKAPLATLVVRQGEIGSSATKERIAAFAQGLRRASPEPAPGGAAAAAAEPRQHVDE